MRLILSILFISQISIAVGMIVSDPEQTSQNVTIIGHLVDSLKKYEKMIETANAQVNKLNEINDFMNKTNAFLKGSSISIASPFEVIDNLKNTISAMKYNAESLGKTFKDFDLGEKIRRKRLNSSCPWLDYTLISPKSMDIIFKNEGEETQLMKDAKELINFLNDDIYSNLRTTMGSLSGRVLAESLCQAIKEEERKEREQQLLNEERKAMISGNMNEYNRLKKERLKAELTRILEDEAALKEKYGVLTNRETQMLESLGVVNKEYNTKDRKYCEEGKNKKGEFCYPKALDTIRLNDEFNKLQEKLSAELASAGTSKEAQAQVYANFNQQSQILMLAYVKDLANHLAFLNETLSLMGSLAAEDFQRKYKRDLNTNPPTNGMRKSEQDIKNSLNNIKPYYQRTSQFDEWGFPKVNLISSGNN